MTMTAIDLTVQFGWLPTALNALLMISAAAIGAHVWVSHRRAHRVPIDVRIPATITAIVGRSPSVPATTDQTPSVTSLPEAA
jgi:predicted thioesterase